MFYTLHPFAGLGLTLDDRPDFFFGTPGNDIYEGKGGDDKMFGSAGADIFFGGSGSDAVDYSNSSSAVQVDLERGFGRGGDADRDRYDSVENAVGSAFGDRLYGNSADNRLNGNDGDDRLYGGDGDDTLIGGEGRDTLYGDANDDTLTGGDGNDTLWGGEDNDELYGDTGDDYLFGGEDKDELYGGADNDWLNGGAGADILDGGSGTDWLDYSGSSAPVKVDLSTNTVSGGDAQGDQISNFENVRGTGGDDELIGNDEENVLFGLSGDDILTGGGGADTFRFSLGEISGHGNDRVTDFETQNTTGTDDILDLRGTQIESLEKLFELSNGFMEETGEGTVIYTGAEGTPFESTVTLLGVSIADLSADNFLL